MIGTPLYLSPEVLKRQPYDARADIWSLGICCIEMATGMPPYANMNSTRAMRMITMKPSPTLPDDQPFSNEFRDFIAQCLIKDPVVRPDAEQLLMVCFLFYLFSVYEKKKFTKFFQK